MLCFGCCHWKKNSQIVQQEYLRTLLRQIRLDAGLRQLDLAEKLGQPQSYVSKYESGERRLDLLELRQVAKRLGSRYKTSFANSRVL